MTSRHYGLNRKQREQIIISIGGNGKELFRCVVDKGHPNGPEIHAVTDNGIIVIYNKRSGKLVTKLIARPAQLLRYGHRVPDKVLRKAQEHEYKCLNY